jgi:hypothetical protein
VVRLFPKKEKSISSIFALFTYNKLPGECGSMDGIYYGGFYNQ